MIQLAWLLIRIVPSILGRGLLLRQIVAGSLPVACAFPLRSGTVEAACP
jgi:hypothetical protein